MKTALFWFRYALWWISGLAVMGATSVLLQHFSTAVSDQGINGFIGFLAGYRLWSYTERWEIFVRPE